MSNCKNIQFPVFQDNMYTLVNLNEQSFFFVENDQLSTGYCGFLELVRKKLAISSWQTKLVIFNRIRKLDPIKFLWLLILKYFENHMIYSLQYSSPSW